MTAAESVKVAVQPLSQSWPTDKREPEARDGKTCTSLAAGGKWLLLRFALCVDVMRSWLGRRTLMGLVVGRMLDKIGLE